VAMANRIKPIVNLPGFSSSTIEKYPVLSEEKQRELGKRLREHRDEAARQLLILHNMRFVIFLAQKWMPTLSRKPRTTLEFSDLIQEGMSGLITAIEKWDYRKGFALTTYARWWIQVQITKCLWEGGVLHIPFHTQRIAHQAVAKMEKFARDEGRAPTAKELAQMLQITQGRADAIFHVLDMSVLSLHETIPQDRGDPSKNPRSAEETIASDRFLTPDRALEAKQELDAACERVNKVMRMVRTSKRISQRNKEVFLEYYAPDKIETRRDMKSLVKKYHVTNQNVYQILTMVWGHIKRVYPAMNREKLVEDVSRIFDLESILDHPVTIG